MLRNSSALGGLKQSSLQKFYIQIFNLWGFLFMVKIIPAILAKSKEEFERKLEIIRPFAQEMQIDVMDGEFVSNTTWGNPKKVKEMNLPPYEVHLMVIDPEEAALVWARAGAKRIFFHFEATDDARAIIQKIKSLGTEAGIAINPETPVSSIANLFDILNAVLVMGVNPGFSGQEFQPVAIKKVAEIRKLNKNVAIEVDGGVSEANAVELSEAGADELVTASAIFSADDPKIIYEKLLKIANASYSRQKS